MGLIMRNGVPYGSSAIKEEFDAGKTVPKGTQYTIGTTVYTVKDNAEIFSDYENNKAIGKYSHAEGTYTTAVGDYSHAEGSSTNATGYISHAQGSGTTAAGSYSHAEGSGTITSNNADNAHAEGYNSVAASTCAHAEGSETHATASSSHAEGNGTTAAGSYSHSEGYGTVANGNASHAEGDNTIALGNQQHVQGKFNIPESTGKYAFIIGNGANENSRSNAFAIDWQGLIYVNNAATGISVVDLLTEINSLKDRVSALENA